MVAKKNQLKKRPKRGQLHSPIYSARFFSDPLPKYEMPEDSRDPRVAYQLIHDEMSLDGVPVLNLASFVTTWMEPEADQLIKDMLATNFIDRDQYPRSQIIEQRCINILARIFHAPESENAVGTSTIGSSEAIMLAGLAHKWNWRARQKRNKRSHDKPNIVMSTGVQIVWRKFAKYFDVEEHLIPMRKGCFTLPPEKLERHVDENTICVVGLLGITETGQFDPIKRLNDKLIEIKRKKGWDVPLHVDAASGGFIAPFIYPHLVWDFRLSQVRSINVSGHKYGLVYPGIGWAIWRDEKELPKDLIFRINYLGGENPTFTLNFSKGASHIIAQYYNFMRLGKEGYRQIFLRIKANADYISKRLRDSGHFALLSDSNSLPVITACLTSQPMENVFKISGELRKKGWMVPAYTMPPDVTNIAVMRIVVKEGLSRDMVESLVDEILKITEALKKIEVHEPGHFGNPNIIC